MTSECSVTAPVRRFSGRAAQNGWQPSTIGNTWSRMASPAPEGAGVSLADGRSRSQMAIAEPLPNKRLKLAGGDRFKGSGVLCPWRGTDCVPHPCAGGRVARSLSAIR